MAKMATLKKSSSSNLNSQGFKKKFAVKQHKIVFKNAGHVFGGGSKAKTANPSHLDSKGFKKKFKSGSSSGGFDGSQPRGDDGRWT